MQVRLRKYFASKTPQNRQNYIQIRNVVISSAKREKAAYISHTLKSCRHVQRKTWKYLKKWGVCSTPRKSISGKLLADLDKIIKFFASVGEGTEPNEETLYFYQNQKAINTVINKVSGGWGRWDYTTDASGYNALCR